MEALRILLVYAFGFAAQEAPRLADLEPERRQTTNEVVFQNATDVPRMRRLASDLARHPDDMTFDKGLTWLIAGIESENGGQAPDG